tara:strand:+ start:286 stop:426 length:141 start_codon:yes stop_codon:yes gene_type:complete
MQFRKAGKPTSALSLLQPGNKANSFANSRLLHKKWDCDLFEGKDFG